MTLKVLTGPLNYKPKKYLMLLLLFTDCRSNPLGISQSLKYVKDAQMTAYKSYSTYYASNARLGGSSYWTGRNKDAYLQIDFGT